MVILDSTLLSMSTTFSKLLGAKILVSLHYSPGSLKVLNPVSQKNNPNKQTIHYPILCLSPLNQGPQNPVLHILPWTCQQTQVKFWCSFVVLFLLVPFLPYHLSTKRSLGDMTPGLAQSVSQLFIYSKHQTVISWGKTLLVFAKFADSPGTSSKGRSQSG